MDNAKIFTFADDTAIIFHSNNWVGVVVATQRGLSTVMKWLQQNLLTLNASKTKYIPFKISKRIEPENPLRVKLHSCNYLDSNSCQCVEIEKVDCIKYLGVLIDNQLSWSKQIGAVTTRVRKLMFVFKNLRNIADHNTIRCVYFALCQSILSYCIVAWGVATKSHLIKLERAQRGILKVAFAKPFRYPTDRLYQDCKVLRGRAAVKKKILQIAVAR
ncbi:hypothetical protein PYW08_000088 [Mythimna loreyi]|uniref:Uncharacterized protein n=1 Tax=Mythimna loreyi TaxID=667449 RepID=A0ACC2RBV7_9NEOP|nr:hypothetical protein PYW08_000088 [Mythimna loreyi]